MYWSRPFIKQTHFSCDFIRHYRYDYLLRTRVVHDVRVGFAYACEYGGLKYTGTSPPQDFYGMAPHNGTLWNTFILFLPPPPRPPPPLTPLPPLSELAFFKGTITSTKIQASQTSETTKGKSIS